MRNIKRRIQYFIVLLGMCAGCQTTKAYRGSVQPFEKIAVLRGESRKTSSVYITKVDDIIKGGFFASRHFELHVLPGEHSVEVGYEKKTELERTAEFNCTLQFTAKANHIYQLYGDQSYLSPMRARLKDLESGQTVGDCQQALPKPPKGRNSK